MVLFYLPNDNIFNETLNYNYFIYLIQKLADIRMDITIK
jgi:hypothetical protein